MVHCFQVWILVGGQIAFELDKVLPVEASLMKFERDVSLTEMGLVE